MASAKVVTGYAEVNGGRIYYEVAGAGSTVVLIHGFSLDTRMWDAQFEVFAQSHRVIRYDVRGFGKSSLPDKPYSNAADLDALLTRLRVDTAAVCGLSMGGGIAVEFALLYPSRVWALVPVDAGGSALVRKDDAEGRAQWVVLAKLFADLARTARSAGVESAKRMWLDHELFAPERESPVLKRELERMVGDYSGWHWVNSAQYLPFKPDHSERYGNISAPSLVVVGERDLPACHSVANGMVSDIPDARLHVIPRAGHMSNMGAPVEFNRVVLDFLATV